MKTKTLLALILASSFKLAAVAQTVTNVALVTGFNVGTNYPVLPTQLITCTGTGGTSPAIKGYVPYAFGNFTMTIGQTYTGLTNISVALTSGTFAYGSFQITTPATTVAVPTNCYLPANALVIPTSVTGPVAISIETSADLTTWTGCNPGTYGPNLGNQRFFRLKALAQ